MPAASTDRTDLTLVLDRSGSMESIRGAMEESLAGMLRQQRDEPGSLRVTLHRFDDRFETPFAAVAADDLPPIRIDPRGSTALLDAMAHAIRLTQDRLDHDEHRPAPRVIVVTITDGHENASRETTWDRLNELVARKQELGWQFLFLGANIDAIATASRIGIREDRAMTYAATDRGVRRSSAALGFAMKRLRGAPVMDDVRAFDHDDAGSADDTKPADGSSGQASSKRRHRR